MSAAQGDVYDFHRALELTIGETPAIRDAQLCADLILEEARGRVFSATVTGKPAADGRISIKPPKGVGYHSAKVSQVKSLLRRGDGQLQLEAT